MSDAVPDLPPGWPTDEHRSRVAARTRALRNRRRATVATATALIAVLVAAGVVALHGTSTPSNVNVATVSSTTTTGPLVASEIATVAEPKGWRIVDYGDARVAAPPGWTVNAPPNLNCGRTIAAGIAITLGTPPCSSIVLEPLGPEKVALGRPNRTIHGIDLYGPFETPRGTQYSVLDLHVSMILRGAGAERILNTLTSSSRRVALAPGPAPRVPGDWQTVGYDGVTLRVPPTWPIKRLGPHDLAPGECSTQNFDTTGVFLGIGVLGAVDCPMIPAGVVPRPTDGVWVTTSPGDNHTLHVTKVLDSSGLRLDISAFTSQQVLVVQAERLGHYTTVTLGLGPDPSVARTILYSIRATDRPG